MMPTASISTASIRTDQMAATEICLESFLGAEVAFHVDLFAAEFNRTLIKRR